MRFMHTYAARIASSLLVLLCLQSAVLAQAERPLSSTPATRTAGSRTEEARAELPDSPGAVRFQSQAGTSQSPAASQTSASHQTSATAQTSADNSQPAQSQTAAPQAAPPQSQQAATASDSKPQQPVGTAVAATPIVSGSPAAQPAGVAIAPAKQHRTRTIVIRVGAVVGAAVAIGTVVALSEGTSSRPPGAR
jgi:hypothetical protein